MRRALLLLCFVVVPAAGMAQKVYGPLAVQLPLGARSLAMGGAGAGARDAEGALGNPALAGASTVASVAVGRYQGGARARLVGTTSSVGVIGVGVAVSYLDYGLPGSPFSVPYAGQPTLVHTGFATAASLAGAFSLSAAFKGMRWGAAATYLEERSDTQRAAVAGVNLGVAKDGLLPNMTLGVTLQNLGPSLRFGDTHVDLPTRLVAGVSGAQLPLNAWFDFTASGDLGVRRDGRVMAALGGELTWVPIEGIALALRTGVRRAELAAQRPVTAGAGLTFDRFSVDYAWEQMQVGGAHRLGLRVGR